jgi:SAM-dependent methyltransferase
MADEREYVLGTNDAELARLGFQHQLWAELSARTWQDAGFGPGQRLLDVGCGPGDATFDLARLAGAAGAVHGVDLSERFVSHLVRQAGVRGLSTVSAQAADLAHVELPAESFDGAWARWVLCFVRDPEQVVARVSRALRPGGTFAVLDYARYEGVYYAPKNPLFEHFFRVVVDTWWDSGGNPHIGMDLPAIMERHGLTAELVEPVVRVATPGTPLWSWPRTFFDNFVPHLVAEGRLSPAERDEFEAAWSALKDVPGAYFHTPPMVRIVARKR